MLPLNITTNYLHQFSLSIGGTKFNSSINELGVFRSKGNNLGNVTIKSFSITTATITTTTSSGMFLSVKFFLIFNNKIENIMEESTKVALVLAEPKKPNKKRKSVEKLKKGFQ